MKWIEIIKISVAENRRAVVEDQIKSVMAELKKEENAETVKLYYNLTDGDLSIHLCWNDGKAQPRGSRAGLSLVHMLKEFGLISHSVWAKKNA